MAVYIFENTTQAQASSFGATDQLVFSNTGTTATSVVVTTSNSFGADITTIAANGVSLSFQAANISTASTSGSIQFGDSSRLVLGTTGADTTLTAAAPATGSTTGSVIYGLTGADSLTGNTGADYLYGGSGADTLVGGAGADHLYGNDLQNNSSTLDGADSILGGAGSDYLQGNAGNDTLDGGTGEDRIFGGSGDDSIIGNDGDDTVNGNTGNDTITGDLGNDFLRGGQGNDSILGGAGNDQLFGDVGADTLVGGAGIDVLTGGADADVFRFDAGDSQIDFTGTGSFRFFTDSVTDYQDGSDQIDLPFTVTAVLTGSGGATFTTVQAARDYAQGLLTGTTATGEVAAVAVGSDTYLFYSDTGTDTINSAIKFNGVAPTVFNVNGTSDFI